MKKLILPITIALISIVSCKDTEYKRISAEQLHMIEDSIPSIIPGVTTIHTIQPEDDLTKVKIIIGDVPFYSATPETKQQKADRLGLAILRVMGKDNNLKNATIVFTQNIKDDNEKPADAVNIEVDLAGMQKTAYPAQ